MHMKQSGNPLLRAVWLEWSAQMQGASRSRSRAWSLLVLLALAIVLTLIVLTVFWSVLLPVAEPNIAAIGVLLALSLSVWTHLNRVRWTEFYLSGWVSTLPVSRRAKQGVVAVRSFALSALLFILLWVALPLLARASPPASAVTQRLLVTCIVAVFVGSLLGWCLPRRTPVSAALPRSPVVGPVASGRASLGALGQWSTLQTQRWFKPRIVSRLIAPAILILPLGTSANLALALLGLWVISLYLLIMLRAFVYVARRCAQWLQPTPVRSGRLVWALGWLPLLMQLVWTLAAMLLLVALGMRPLFAARVAEGWLAIASLVSTLVLAQARGVRHMRLRAIFSFGLLAVLERWRNQWVIPATLLISIWQLRSTPRVRV
jgi:hypothetical protein